MYDRDYTTIEFTIWDKIGSVIALMFLVPLVGVLVFLDWVFDDI